MAEFYVTLNEDAQGSRIVHRTTCLQLPVVDSLRYIGSYASGEAAYDIAKGYYHSVDYCPACLAAK
ncbi:MAG: hypothetical protein QM709_12785 [Spongiibacteraceae bacterium]